MEWAGWVALAFLSLCSAAGNAWQAVMRQRERKQLQEIHHEDFRDEKLSQVWKEDRERLATLERKMESLQNEVGTLRVELAEARSEKALIEKDLALANLELKQAVEEKIALASRVVELEAGRSKLVDRIGVLEAQLGIRNSND